eukprot:TRINITY_DN16255_c0_g1_i1.p1 TRINITY_DN16255_c0_g1~~TRINITY_DN16255_c0_g1_i1.p1  ORF type:complete len:178 (-),score=49.79 TRINITY_DN16255_c0_g1_i1:332-865(-)
MAFNRFAATLSLLLLMTSCTQGVAEANLEEDVGAYKQRARKRLEWIDAVIWAAITISVLIAVRWCCGKLRCAEEKPSQPKAEEKPSKPKAKRCDTPKASRAIEGDTPKEDETSRRKKDVSLGQLRRRLKDDQERLKDMEDQRKTEKTSTKKEKLRVEIEKLQAKMHEDESYLQSKSK